MAVIHIDYFSDLLCVWAYVAQIRVDELKSTFGDQIWIDYHFIPVFGDAHRKLEKRWHDRGGLPAYNQHVKEVVNKFNHVNVHPDIWLKNPPRSSSACHLYLQAIKLVQEQGLIELERGNESKNHALSPFEQAICAFREAFFLRLEDVADRSVQEQIAIELGLPIDAIAAQINSGAAYAELSKDFDLIREHSVSVSPTMIFNEGRQRLNGNVGYRVIEANIRELLANPSGEQSWC
ncbi:DsbA oxidoreductase [Thalassoporum mexicanum PCC 7367]|uniref:DsbA family oxidoreductase n=1 Tax=Thalassoporum mexicanum TaxID=3457544 RepID=UPI00029FA025|nr:DsbA family protein [Pseudanabaena sp. PCC 7367]AFY68707.1 DsbA oxidoreductase [Pseudanabaena sp. PCC 7367]